MSDVRFLMSDFPSRSTANSRSQSSDSSWICREDFGIERNQSFKGDHGNAQFSLCCTSTAMPDDDSQDRHPAFCFATERRIRKAGTEKVFWRNSMRVIPSSNSPKLLSLAAYFSSRETWPAASSHRPSRLINVSVNCKTRSNGLPSPVPFTRLSENNRHVIAIDSRFHRSFRIRYLQSRIGAAFLDARTGRPCLKEVEKRQMVNRKIASGIPFYFLQSKVENRHSAIPVGA